MKRVLKKLTLKGYVDSDFAGDKVQRKSTSAYFFTLVDTCITEVPVTIYCHII